MKKEIIKGTSINSTAGRSFNASTFQTPKIIRAGVSSSSLSRTKKLTDC